MDQAIEAMNLAYASLSSGNAEVPLRSRIEIEDHAGTILFMPAKATTITGTGVSIKVVSVYPNNPNFGKPTIHASMLIIDEKDGRMLAMLEGATLTAIRTGAGSGVATDLLAKADSKVVAIIGSGAQAKTQLEAVCEVRDIETVFVYSPNTENATTFSKEIAGIASIPKTIHVVKSADEAISQADIICTATNSSTPVFSSNAVKPGTHINAVGSFTKNMQEIPNETMVNGSIFVDSLEACLVESGELATPLQENLFKINHVRGEIGDLINGKIEGRTTNQEITIFKSVGVAIQDTIAAQVAVSFAEKMSIGQIIDW
jgi:alanine dehydrogenase